MSEYIITKCRICGRLMKRYGFQVYKGDESCCSDCNKEVESGEEITNLDRLTSRYGVKA